MHHYRPFWPFLDFLRFFVTNRIHNKKFLARIVGTFFTGFTQDSVLERFTQPILYDLLHATGVHVESDN